ncbi:MAG: Nif3-like dinuclear metal center hexameric protein [Candidatus Dadabacteria bacterium]|nr:MAG: Nif3-like dinuclear metal center hexameric protein [Candidatus Dadabacteria bacterium]
MATAADIIAWLNDVLDIPGHPDFGGAHNGVQVEPPDQISVVATAVDACAHSAEAAREAGAQMLLVHHGMFWGGVQPVTRERYRLLSALLAAPCGLYSAHLPLDSHELYGNNAILADRLGLDRIEPFGTFEGCAVGRIGDTSLDGPEAAAARLGFEIVEAVPPVRAGRLAVVSGNGGSLVREAALVGASILLTGEVDHHDRVLARDLGLGIWCGGHYQTETVGVRALGQALAEAFDVTHVPLDLPTGG